MAIDEKVVNDHLERGKAYCDEKKYDQSIAELDQVIRLDPNFAGAYGIRGGVFFRKGDLDKAIDDYNQAIRINPNDEKVYSFRGMAYRIKGDLDRAIADYETALRINSNVNDNTKKELYEMYSKRGIMHFDAKEYDLAITDYDKAIQLDPNNIEAYVNRGCTYGAKDSYDQAIADFNQAIRINPNDSGTYGSRGFTYSLKGDYDKATADYEAAIRINPNDAYAKQNLDEMEKKYLGRGQAYCNDGIYDRAITDYETVLRINPSNANAKQLLKNAQAKQKNKGAKVSATQSHEDNSDTTIVSGTNLAAKLAWLQSNAKSNGKYIIEVNEDETIEPQKLSYNGGSNITIGIKGTNSNRIINLSSEGTLFEVGEGVTLTLNENITLRGRNNNDKCLIDVHGTLVMNSGSAIADNINILRFIGDAGGVSVNETGIFIMNGGMIYGNTSSGACGGGGVRANGTFIMKGGTIYSNTCTEGTGAGVDIYINSIFTKTGGTITGYESDANNGNVVISEGKVADYSWARKIGHAISYHGDVVDGKSMDSVFRDTTTGPTDNMSYEYGDFTGVWDGKVGNKENDAKMKSEARKIVKEKYIANCTEEIQKNPENAKAYMNRGNAYMLKTEYSKAIADFAKVMQLDPNNKEAVSCLEKAKKCQKNERIGCAIFMILIVLLAWFFFGRSAPAPQTEAEQNKASSVPQVTTTQGSFTDPRDSKTYKTVKINAQTWLAENLNYNAKASKCYNNKPENCEKYGQLYNWATAKTVCPAGWHLPSSAEWDKLYRQADGTNGTESPYNSETGGKHLKAASGWKDSGSGTDKFGFAALPGGSGNPKGKSFQFLGETGYWWSSSENTATNAYYRYIAHDKDIAGFSSYASKEQFLSVRCMQD